MTTPQPAPPAPKPTEETESPKQAPKAESPPPKDEPRSPDTEGKSGGTPEKDDKPKKSDPLQDDENARAPSEDESSIPESLFEKLLDPRGFRVDDLHSDGAFAMGPGATSIKNQYNGTARPEFRPLPRTEESVRDDLAAHVAAPSDELLNERLRDQQLVCLLGEPRSGRTQSALAALAERHGNGKIVDLIGPRDAPLSAATREADLLDDGCGHLLRLDTAKLNRRELTDLQSTARHHGASVVVIADRAGELGDLTRFVVDHVPPDPVDVFEAHLRRLLIRDPACAPRCSGPTADCPKACIDAYVTWCLEDQKLRAELSAIHSPQEAMQLASTIATKRVACETDLRAVMAGLFTHLVKTARKLLAAPDETDAVKRHWLRAFRIAYTVLGDCPRAAVTDAASDLFTRMKPVTSNPVTTTTANPETSVEETPVQPPDIPFEELIPKEMRDRRDDAEDAGAGPSTDRIAPAIFDVAWNDYPFSPRILMSWLDQLVVQRNAKVRSRAAVAAGVFAGFDRELVFGELIDGWAKHLRAGARQAAALACVFAMQDKRLTAIVPKRIRAWIRTDRPFALDTVARAYATGLCDQISMRTVLRDLHRIACHDWYWFSPMVALAMKRLLTQDTASVLVAEMHRWLVSGRLALAVQAGRTMAEIAKDTTPTSLIEWPTVLCWDGDAPEHLNQVTALWCNALLLPPSAFKAWRALEDWIHAAGFDPRLEEIVLEVMERLLVAEPLRIRTRFHLDRVWSLRLSSHPVAARVAEMLKEADQ